MCGRIYVKSNGAYEILLAELGIREPLPTLLNVAPTASIPVIRQSAPGRYSLDNMRWWLHPAWSPSPPDQNYAMFNARIETVLTSRAFKGPIRKQRSIIPVDGFIEWKTHGKSKTPYYVNTADGSPLLFAGIWENWRDQVFSCAIITQPATDEFKDIHHRMPLSLTVDQSLEWLDLDGDGSELISRFSGQSLDLRPQEITSSINNARNKVEVTFVSN